MIYQEVNFNNFCDSFPDSYKNNFSYDGKLALYNYLNDLSEDTGGNIELDTIALCCEYTEYTDLEEIKGLYDDYFIKHNIKTIEDLQDHTQVITLEDNKGYIIADF